MPSLGYLRNVRGQEDVLYVTAKPVDNLDTCCCKPIAQRAIEAVHAMAPNAKIVFLGGDPYGYGTAEEMMAEALGIATSNSWTFNASESVAPIFEPALGRRRRRCLPR